MSATEFSRRRRELLHRIGPDGVAVLAAATHCIRNRDTEYPFRQDSDFYYLTGFAEPDALAVFIPGRKEGEYVLFCRPRHRAQEVWTGRRAGPVGAVRQFGADQALTLETIDAELPRLLAGRQRVYYRFGHDAGFDRRLLGWVNQVRHMARAGVRAPTELIALETVLHELRLIKSRAEIATMREAARISTEAHRRAMRATRPGRMEFEIEAEIVHEFRRGSAESAYPPIVGGGANACVLHYTANAASLRDGDLLLIDAGAEYDYYAADITRTFPVNGRYTEPQRAIHELVLAAQEAAIAVAVPGNRWNDPHEQAVAVLTRGLIKLGLLSGTPRRLIKDGEYRRFYMHRTGHWLGMDVHDVGDYKVDGDWRRLQPGMVMTVEPGLYIPARSQGVAKHWWNIGVRIEDDVLVTAGEPDVLTDAAPKSATEIEAWMNAA